MSVARGCLSIWELFFLDILLSRYFFKRRYSESNFITVVSHQRNTGYGSITFFFKMRVIQLVYVIADHYGLENPLEEWASTGNACSLIFQRKMATELCREKNFTVPLLDRDHSDHYPTLYYTTSQTNTKNQIVNTSDKVIYSKFNQLIQEEN